MMWILSKEGGRWFAGSVRSVYLNEVLKFRILKTLVPFALAIFILTSCGEPTQLSEVENVNDAIKRVDYVIGLWDKDYRELCDGPRNDSNKEAFSGLSEEIREYYGAGEKCIYLDYSQQSQVQEYVTDKLSDYPHLVNLSSYGSIDCW